MLHLRKGDIDKAVEELAEKNKRTIERETAIKWAARAVAAHRDDTDRDWVHREEDYTHEALEHAAMAGSKFLQELMDELKSLGLDVA